MRRRTITLVMVGLVLALFVLPAAAQAVLQEATAEDVPPVVTGDSWDYYTEPHVVMYTYPVPDPGPVPDCSLDEGFVPKVEDGELAYDDEGNLKVVDSEGVESIADLDDGCRAVLIEGPNGQVNHGQFVSNMVHDLKDDYDKEDGPFGQWVKKFAQDDVIGKGDLQVKPDKDDDLEPLEAAELNDEGENKGKPDHANSKKPKKNK